MGFFRSLNEKIEQQLASIEIDNNQMPTKKPIGKIAGTIYAMLSDS